MDPCLNGCHQQALSVIEMENVKLSELMSLAQAPISRKWTQSIMWLLASQRSSFSTSSSPFPNPARSTARTRPLRKRKNKFCLTFSCFWVCCLLQGPAILDSGTKIANILSLGCFFYIVLLSLKQFLFVASAIGLLSAFSEFSSSFLKSHRSVLRTFCSSQAIQPVTPHSLKLHPKAHRLFPLFWMCPFF